MQLNPIFATRDASTANSTSTLGSAVQQVQNNNQLNEQAFLKLLSTQLANQDPTQPQDETQMLAQLAQFSTVEGINTLDTNEASQQATGLLGKTVNALTTVNNSPQVVSGVVQSVNWNGSKVSLTLDSGASVTLDEITQVNDTATK